MANTYIISYSSYDFRGEGPRMIQFKGEYRQLLQFLNGINDSTRHNPLDEETSDRTLNDLTNEELIQYFNASNGDGQPWIQVWSVEEEKLILGGGENE